jgi:nicotinate-nucleotide pyrophosphorylase (carboxylating)
MRAEEIDSLIQRAILEDMPKGDITSESIIPSHSHSKAVFLAKEDGVLAGIDIAKKVFQLIDPSITYQKIVEDGRIFRKGKTLAQISGLSISLLKGERTALNFLQRLSGIASITHRFVQAISGTQTKILDTRKTTPGLRILEKYAVRMGGGENHRLNLSEMVLIKDNHLQVVGSITEAVKKARKSVSRNIKIEVETTTFEEVKEAFRCGADMIMLDNMSLEEMRNVLTWLQGRVPVEASGEVSLGRVQQIAALGVNYISVGSLTHSYRSLNISMEFRS